MKKNVGFKELPFEKKVEHIWEYYKIPILVVLFLLLVVGPMVVEMFTKPQPELNVILMNANGMDDDLQITEITDESFRPFFEDSGREYYSGIVSLNTTLVFNEITPDTNSMDAQMFYQQNAEQSQALYVTLAAGGSDLMFGTGPYFTVTANMGVYMDLTQILPEELLTKWQDCFVYSDNDGETEPYPCAVKLPASEWLKSIGYRDGCCFGVLANGGNTELAVEFAQYLLNNQ